MFNYRLIVIVSHFTHFHLQLLPHLSPFASPFTPGQEPTNESDSAHPTARCPLQLTFREPPPNPNPADGLGLVAEAAAVFTPLRKVRRDSRERVDVCKGTEQSCGFFGVCPDGWVARGRFCGCLVSVRLPVCLSACLNTRTVCQFIGVLSSLSALSLLSTL